MKISLSRSNRGIALIIVMMVILVLGFLAGGFAYSMKVETKLARNSNYDSEFEWLGRSGVELARYVLGQHMTVPNEGNYDALNQKWAGGPMGTNEVLANISLENVPLGNGTFTVKIIDLERYYNINFADDITLRQGLTLMGVDAAEMSPIVDSILDWMDADDNTHLSGTESDYYLTMQPAYYAKNGPIDDLAELMMVRYVTPEIYWGPNGTNVSTAPVPVAATIAASTSTTRNSRLRLRNDEPVVYSTGLVELFTPISARVININTASANVFQLIPGLDANIAAGIITQRAGPDGMDGTEDDVPFRNAGELINVPGLNTQAVATMQRLFSVRSATFRVNVEVTIDGRTRKCTAILRRTDPRDIRVLQMYWD
ncbi:MAG: hypothetical protein AB1705_20585 [Verrucomicrobiota bacterium]